MTAVQIPRLMLAPPTGWWSVWRGVAPRPSRLRVDRRGDHTYLAEDWPLVEPQVPYAVNLTGWDNRFRLVAFDLDARRGDVGESCARVQGLLDDAGVEYVVAASGPTGGRHIWSAWPQGLDAGDVRRLAQVLPVLAPALDAGCLLNPSTGCVRPIGAPHRHGGRAELLAGSPERAAAVLQVGNPSGRWQALLAVLPAELRERAAGEPAAAAIRQSGAPGAAAADDGGATPRYDQKGQSSAFAAGPDAGEPGDELAGRRARLVVVEAGRPRLAGTRRGLSAETVRLLRAPVPVSADASGVLWQCLLRLVFARHSFADALGLLDDPGVGGFEHLRSKPAGAVRVPRSVAAGRAELARQWDKAVDKAVEWYRGTPAGIDDALAVLVDRVQGTAAGVDAARWGEQSGPTDRAVLDAVCLLVLNHNVNPVGASVRMVADRAGIGASTAQRALVRLSRPDSTGRTWLAAVEAAEGRNAATWQLLDAITEGSEPDIGGSVGACTGGTQGNPPPAVPPRLGMDLAVELQAKLDHQRSDVWTPRGGLGHHTARTHAALMSRPRTLLELTWLTGYGVRTVLRHVRRLVALRLVEVDGTTVAATERALDEVARELGVEGTGAARRLRHTVEREVLAWWTAEQAWRSTRGKTERVGRRRARRGPPTPVAGAAQAALPVAVDARHTYGTFPVHSGGLKRRRADFAAAARMVHAHLTRHPSTRAAA